jgi:glycosyltransferase involved in cell wall biosynthesis
MEFMALGKPMVVTGGGGTKELIENNVSGIIIESGKPELLVEKINYLLNNPVIALEMGEKAKERIKNQFNIDKMVDAYLSVYQSFQQQPA